MSHIISVRNVNHALEESMWWLHTAGTQQASRNGPVLRAPGPVLIETTYPDERVLLNATRDANPFFHLMEALWMLGGRDDVAFVSQFVPHMKEYSDDGAILHGAYGFRWRQAFARDQLEDLYELLTMDPYTRRAVLQMWHADYDLNYHGKDLPCNTHVYFQLREDSAYAQRSLDMTVCCRSNDAVWGAHGANAVHFSVLQEYMAHRLDARLGVMRQFANDYHVYTERHRPDKLRMSYVADKRYDHEAVFSYPLATVGHEEWQLDLKRFLSDPLGDTEYQDNFFSSVAAPMYAAHHDYRRGRIASALVCAEGIAASDWRTACVEWLQRRADKTAKKEAKDAQ